MAAQAAHSHKIATGNNRAVNLLSGDLGVIEPIILGRFGACHPPAYERLPSYGNVGSAPSAISVSESASSSSRLHCP
jgi:hypothetical protein